MATIIATILNAVQNTANSVTGKKPVALPSTVDDYHDFVTRGGPLRTQLGYGLNTPANPLVAIGFQNGLSGVDRLGDTPQPIVHAAGHRRRVSSRQGVFPGVTSGSAIDATDAGVRLEKNRQTHVAVAQSVLHSHTSRLVIQ